MKNLLFLIVLFAFGSFGYTQVTHSIYNITDFGPCSGYNLFGSFNDSGNCPPSFAGVNCFDIPLGVTTHTAFNESCDTITNINDIRGMTIKEQASQNYYYVSFCDNMGNLILNGSENIPPLLSCFPPIPVSVSWTIQGNTIYVTIQ